MNKIRKMTKTTQNSEQNFSILQEILRKTFHLLILLVPIGYEISSKSQMLKIIAPITVFVLFIDYFRHKNQFIKLIFESCFQKIMRAKESEKFCGISYFLTAALLILIFAKKEIAIISFLILAISDASASLIGKSLPSKSFFEKSIAGSLAFYISGAIIILASGNFFSLGIMFYIFAFFALFVSTIIEARPSFFNVDDNFSIPVSFAAVMTIFDLIWGLI